MRVWCGLRIFKLEWFTFIELLTYGILILFWTSVLHILTSMTHGRLIHVIEQYAYLFWIVSVYDILTLVPSVECLVNIVHGKSCSVELHS